MNYFESVRQIMSMSLNELEKKFYKVISEPELEFINSNPFNMESFKLLKERGWIILKKSDLKYGRCFLPPLRKINIPKDIPYNLEKEWTFHEAVPMHSLHCPR